MFFLYASSADQFLIFLNNFLQSEAEFNFSNHAFVGFMVGSYAKHFIM